MAVKFSQFVVETNKANVNYLVGWDGTENVQITPVDLLSGYSQGTGAAGQVTFFSAASTVTGDNDFYWDNANKRLGIGTTTPSSFLEVKSDSTEYAAMIRQHTNSGYAPASILLQATSQVSRGAGLYHYNSVAQKMWYTGTLYNQNSDVFGICYKPVTGFDASTAQFSHAKLFINSNGNVGIGASATNPAAKLEVNGTFIATGISQLGSGGANVLLTSSSAGNVGIGTSSPNNKLVVNGTVHLGSNGSDVTIGASNSSVIFMLRSGYNYIQASDASGALMFRTGGSNNRMIIDSSGNVGIGTTSPDAKLDVLGRIGLNDGNNNVSVGDLAGDALTTGNNNTVVGYYALSAETLGDRNVALGAYALHNQNNTSDTDVYNVAIGYQAGLNVTSGVRNTLVGGLAGDAITTGNYNVALGYTALGGEDAGSANTAIGYAALAVQDAGNAYNTAVGFEAGKVISTGVKNTSIGARTMQATTVGQENVALGYQALFTNVDGSKSVAIGANSLLYQEPASAVDMYNTAVGYNSGYSVTTGIQNTLIGGLAGDAITDANNNIAIGYLALTTETSGGNNVAIGVTALQQSNGGTYNVAIGRDSGQQVTTGDNNTLIGAESGDALTTGSSNVVIGYDAADVLLDGGQNTLVGDQVAGSLTSGDENTYIGRRAASSATTGNSNVAIGAGVSLSSATVSNEANIFNGSVTARFQGAAAAWSFVSDARDKKDIEDLELGVEFINKLKPRKFKWDLRDSDRDKNKKASGFVAQEIQEILDETGVDYTGIVDTNNPDQYTVAQANIIPMLVKAIQELSAEVKELKSKI